MNLILKKVKLKAVNELRKFARYLGGDMSEDVHYFIRMSSGDLIENEKEPTGSFHAIGFHVLDHGEEFLVVDHPNPISKQQYDTYRALFEEQDENRSMKGVF